MRLHQRHVIRNAVMATLLAAQTPAEDRIVATRLVPWKPNQLPAIAVYTLRESVDPASQHHTRGGARELTRMADLAIEAATKATDNLDDALDALALAIEIAVDRDETFGGVAADALLVHTELDMVEQGDQLVGVIRLTYRVSYQTVAPDARDEALDDLITVDIRHDLEGEQAAADQAHDLVTDLDA